MVKKTLLSLAIAATAAGLAGCNVSSTDKYDNDVDSSTVEASKPGAVLATISPVFSGANAQLPLAIDIVLADAANYDGTVNVNDTTPPVTTALNKLDGFSTVAPIYVEFTGALKEQTVVANQTVLLLKASKLQEAGALKAQALALAAEAQALGAEAAQLQSQAEAAAAENDLALAADLGAQAQAKGALAQAKAAEAQAKGAEAQAASDAAPFTQFEARYVALDNGTTHAVQILLKEPLEPSTQYFVMLNDGIKGEQGQPTVPSAEYALVSGNDPLFSSALEKLRPAVKAWSGAANSVFEGKPVKPILSYTFTTGGTVDVLSAMAAPAAVVSKLVAAGDIPAAQASAVIAGLDAAIDAPKPRDYEIIPGIQLSFDTLLVKGNREALAAAVPAAVLTALSADLTAYINTGDRAVLDSVIDTMGSGSFGAEAQAAAPVLEEKADAIDLAATAVSKGSIVQGALKLPAYLNPAETGKTETEFGSWTGSDAAAQALGRTGAPLDKAQPGKTANKNVTRYFPFAEKVGDVVVPVMVAVPDVSQPCAQPLPVVIYSHGFTVDRTAGLGVANTLTANCVAMVAIDHPAHGVAGVNMDNDQPVVNTRRIFNVDKTHPGLAQNAALAALSPFAAARAQALTVAPGSYPLLAELSERHNYAANTDASGAAGELIIDYALDENNQPVLGASSGTSGEYFINLKDFSRTRDIMRQSVLDLMNLHATIPTMTVNGYSFTNSDIYYVGHSLGGILGATYLGLTNSLAVAGVPQIKAAALGNPGGGLVKLLENSPGIGWKKILPGLKQAANLDSGTSKIEKFFGVFQATLDSVDPINFAANITTPTLVYSAVGGVEIVNGQPVVTLPDLVVPNNGEALHPVPLAALPGAIQPNADTAKSYLAGTDPLVAQLDKGNAVTVVDKEAVGNASASTPVAISVPEGNAVVLLSKGDHSTFSNAEPRNVFAETYSQIIQFFKGNQAAFFAKDATVIGEQAGE